MIDKRVDIFNSGRELFYSKGFKDTNVSDIAKMANDLDDEMIIAIFNSILYVGIHKREIGIHHFPQILYYLTEFIMKGLTDCRK